MRTRGRHETEESGFSWGESLIRGLVDLFLLTLLWIVAQQPEFGLNGVIVLDRPDQEEKEPQAQNRGDRMVLRADGALLWNDEPIDRAAAVARLGKGDPEKTVLLVIETADNGSGPLREFFEFQIACSKAGVWQRIVLPYRAQAPTGGPNT